MQFIGRDQVRSVSPRRLIFLGSSAALSTQPDLDDVLDEREFGRAAYRAGKAIAHAIDFVAPVEVRIDVDDRQGADFVKGAQYRIGNAVVATEHDRQAASLQNLAHGNFRAAVVVARFCQIRQHVPTIDETNVGAALEQRAVDVEVIVVRRAHDSVGDFTDHLRCAGLVVAERVWSVGRTERDAQHRDVRDEIFQIRNEVGVKQCLMASTGRDGKCFHANEPLVLNGYGQNLLSSKRRLISTPDG